MESTQSSKCPICKKPSDEKYRPFCSKRCAEIDLAHWLRGDYKIEDNEDEGAAGKKDNGGDEER